MSHLPRPLRQPFWQAVLLIGVAYLLFRVGIAYLPPLVGLHSAPVPQSVQLEYMVIAIVGVMLYMSAEEERWREFKQPLHRLMIEPGQRRSRQVLLVAVPALLALAAYRQIRPSYGAPPTLRSVHPAPPNQITFRGKTLSLSGLENPLRTSGSMEEHLRTGARVYVQNCVPCHGDRLDGRGHFAHAFHPVPADFTDNGTIAQLTESYVFWRIAKGGPGLPHEGTPWNSAMPSWEPILTEYEIWSVILFLYDQTGWTPRTWEVAVEEGE